MKRTGFIVGYLNNPLVSRPSTESIDFLHDFPGQHVPVYSDLQRRGDLPGQHCTALLDGQVEKQAHWQDCFATVTYMEDVFPCQGFSLAWELF